MKPVSLEVVPAGETPRSAGFGPGRRARGDKGSGSLAVQLTDLDSTGNSRKRTPPVASAHLPAHNRGNHIDNIKSFCQPQYESYGEGVKFSDSSLLTRVRAPAGVLPAMGGVRNPVGLDACAGRIHGGLVVPISDGLKGRRAPQNSSDQVLLSTSEEARVRTLDRSTPLLAGFQDTPLHKSHHLSTIAKELNCDSLIRHRKQPMGKIECNSKTPSDATESVLASQSNPIATGARTSLNHLAATEDADHFPSLFLSDHAGDVDSSENPGRLDTLSLHAKTSPDAGGALNFSARVSGALGVDDTLNKEHDEISTDAGGRSEFVGVWKK